MFRLIAGSKLPAAERFERWVFEGVLPTIHKTGNRPALDHSTHSANAITPFQFESKDVRIQLDEANAPWFNANDVCAVLEFGNARQAIESHVDVEDVQKLDATDNLGRTRQTNHINESGLYALIMGSTKPAAKRFKRWVTSEVLPTLRKTGTYSTPGRCPPCLGRRRIALPHSY
ncbi:BRO family protein [Xylella fastidiosa]